MLKALIAGFWQQLKCKRGPAVEKLVEEDLPDWLSVAIQPVEHLLPEIVYQ